MNDPHSCRAFAAQHRDVENTLNFARDIHEAQLRLKESNPRLYDRHVHAGIVSFHLRTVSRKLDALLIELRRHSWTQRPRFGVSKRALRLQQALSEYNAGVAGGNPWDLAPEAAAQALDLAFDCFESIDNEIRLIAEIAGQTQC